MVLRLVSENGNEMFLRLVSENESQLTESPNIFLPLATMSEISLETAGHFVPHSEEMVRTCQGLIFTVIFLSSRSSKPHFATSRNSGEIKMITVEIN